MSAQSSIEWTDRTWNPVRGCSVVSPGCVNCYAMKQAHRFSGEGKPYHGLTKQTKAGPQWTGQIRTVEAALLKPLSWRKPARVFVNSMSDLFHEDVPDHFIDRVFAVMAQCPRHTFQILTKRPGRMCHYLDANRPYRIAAALPPDKQHVGFLITRGLKLNERVPEARWPLPNVWLGVSVEDQKHADQRIPLLLQTPAAVRFISAEPLLGPIEFSDVTGRSDAVEQWGQPALSGIDWVIVGGESGPRARPFNVGWARSIAVQCHNVGVPIFIKQLGADPFEPYSDGTRFADLHLRDRKGGDMAEWSEDLRVRQFPEERA